MPAPIDLTGHRYGRLLVLDKGPPKVFPSSKPKTQWKCLCECGTESLHIGNNLRRGITTSCGCLNTEVVVRRSTTHGHTRNRKFSGTYASWATMMSRCHNENVPTYQSYGAKGVRVCKRWRSFSNFLSDMGERPKETTLGRFGDKGNYQPSNCAWMTRQEQTYHRSRKLKMKGETKTLKEWAELHGIGYRTLQGRLNRGWDVREAVTTPPRPVNRDYSK